MNPVTAFGYLTAALLVVLAILAAASAFMQRDWSGVLVAAAFLGVGVVLGHALWSAGKRTRHSGSAVKKDLGWYGESISAFIRGPVLHSAEGLVFLIASTVLAWAEALSYPWCTAEEVARIAPRNALLAPVLQNLSAYASGVNPSLRPTCPSGLRPLPQAR